ncbi:MAG: T9SS type A sorting domain-containing protein [Candidatus Cloacimonetes bacterium]|nr:T9SS type A sorting domain-containing protein [Candidatus Cloacimonadota bacterium]
MGDITYQGTIPGEVPDDPENPNLNDYFGLATDKKIFIKYKHRDPETNEIMSPNCDDVMLYGAYIALGRGDEEIYGDQACHYDGALTFEYQHPHGSTPDFNSLSPYTTNDTLYNYIDFHKFVFPQSDTLPDNIQGFNLNSSNIHIPSGYPYYNPDYYEGFPNNDPNNYIFPDGTDYPWYNPVWPEPYTDIVFERGDLHIFGTIAQTRRGFMHRSGTDNDNHSEENGWEWDLDNFHFGGYHPPTGYNKSYHGDKRLQVNSPFNFEEITRKNGGSEFFITKLLPNNPSETIFSYQTDSTISDFQMAEYNGFTVLAYTTQNNELCNLTKNDEDEIVFYLENPFEFYNKLEDVEFDEDGNIVILSDTYLYKIIDNQLIHLGELEQDNVKDLLLDDQSNLIYCEADMDSEISFHYLDGLDLLPLYDWDIGCYNLKNIVLSKADNDSLNILLLYDQGSLKFSTGSLPSTYSNDDIVEAKVLPKLFNYPNPFNPETTISFSLNSESVENTELIIFNIKGQKVKTFSNLQINKSPNQQIIWDGTDYSDKPVSSGIYLYKLVHGNKVLATNKMLLLK